MRYLPKCETMRRLPRHGAPPVEVAGVPAVRCASAYRFGCLCSPVSPSGLGRTAAPDSVRTASGRLIHPTVLRSESAVPQASARSHPAASLESPARHTEWEVLLRLRHRHFPAISPP